MGRGPLDCRHESQKVASAALTGHHISLMCPDCGEWALVPFGEMLGTSVERATRAIATAFTVIRTVDE